MARFFVFAVFLACQYASAQTVLFKETFDGPSGPDSVITYNTNPGLNSSWNDTSTIAFSGASCFHTQIAPQDSVIFETQPFSTVGRLFVYLSFKHIAKIHFGQRCYVQVSIDSGATWQTLISQNYMGNSPFFAQAGGFNELSYPSPTEGPYWGGPSITQPFAQPNSTWWAQELFDISLLTGNALPGINGYPNVKIRFVAAHVVNATANPSGWYVDDVVVSASNTFEYVPPKINFSAPTASRPRGPYYLPNALVRFRGSDKRGLFQSGLQDGKLYYRKNGGLWQTLVMTKSLNFGCVDSSFFETTLPNLAIGDTVDWYVTLDDCSFQLNTSPQYGKTAAYYTFWLLPAPPIKCGPLSGTIAPFVVNSLPYFQDFEGPAWVSGTGTGATGTAHRGSISEAYPPNGENWSCIPATNVAGYGWSVRNQPTATNATGPSGNHTPNGVNYLYVEASQGLSLDVAELILPCVDLTQDSCAVLEFYTHMFGAHVNELRVDIDTSTTLPLLWQNAVWQQNGSLQASSNDAWQRIVVPLKSFAGKIIKIRFTAIRGTNDRGDIAIDDIRIYSPSPNDVAATEILNPSSNACSYANNEAISARFTYFGCSAPSKIPVGFRVTNTSTSAQTTYWDTIYNPNLSSFDTLFTFSDSADFSVSGNYSIHAFCAYAADGIPTNDTAAPLNLTQTPPFSSFPYLCTFDDAPWQAGNNTTTNPGIFDADVFIPNPLPALGVNAWIVGRGHTPSATTGPNTDFTTTEGNYLFFDAPIAGTGNLSASYVSRCLDFTGMQNPHISFWYHMYGTNCNLILQAQLAGANTWTTIPNSTLNAPQQLNATDNWMYKTVDLSMYAGQVVRLRFVASMANLPGTGSNTAIDNLMIYEKTNIDIGLGNLVLPPNFINLPTSQAPQLSVFNNGTQPISNVTFTMIVTPRCTGIADTISTLFTPFLVAGITSTINFFTVPNYPEGEFDITVFIDVPNDGISLNDTLKRVSIGRKRVNVFSGYAQNFDSCITFNEGYSPRQNYQEFKVNNAASSPFNSAHSAPNVLSIQRKSNQLNDVETVLLPSFIGFDSIIDAQLTFWHNYDFGPSTYGGVEYFDFFTSEWQPLGNIGTSTGCDSVYTLDVLGKPRWNNNSNGWQQVCLKLNRFNSSTSDVRLRFIVESFAEGQNMNWAIDDIQVELSRAPYDLSAEELEIENLPVVFQDSLAYNVKVKNVGMHGIGNYQVHASLDGNYLGAKLVTASPKLKTLFIQQIQQKVSSSALLPGLHTLCIWVKNPNGKIDINTGNDTICQIFEILEPVVNYPFCTNLETEKHFIADWELNSNTPTVWEYGSPAKNTINQAQSGTKCWITGLSNNYAAKTAAYIYTLPFTVNQGTCYKLSFYHNFLTEGLLDGGNVEYTLDSGKTWLVLGNFGDSTWYNQPYVFSLGLNTPGFSGNSNGWQQAFWQGNFATSGLVFFRFLFASNVAVENEGWAIDDVCFEQLQNPCNIGVAEYKIDNTIVISPVPASSSISINRTISNGRLSASILNSTGAVIGNFSMAHNQQHLHYDVSNLPNGVYTILFKNDADIAIHKIVIAH